MFLGHSQVVTAQKREPSNGASCKEKTPSNWEIGKALLACWAEVSVSSEHRRAARAAAAGERSRSIFQANLTVVWECVRVVGVSYVSENRAASWLAVRWD